MKDTEKTANLMKLLKMLKMRLRSSGSTKQADSFGNDVYIDSDIYATEMLITFLEMSLSDFNSVPYFTFYSFEDSKIIETFAAVLVEGATLYALGSQALIERGREFAMTDNGLTFTPPSLAELLQTQYSQLCTSHYEKLKYIKLHWLDFKE